MKLLVIGAAGEIGSAVLAAALESGHEVTAFVRLPDKLGELRDRVIVVQGDLTDAAEVTLAMAGQDVVMTTIGSSPDKAQLDVPATAMRSVLAAMESVGVGARIVAVSDVYEALTADRPYRAAWSPERALEVMRLTAGQHLGADIVEAIPDVVA